MYAFLYLISTYTHTHIFDPDRGSVADVAPRNQKSPPIFRVPNAMTKPPECRRLGRLNDRNAGTVTSALHKLRPVFLSLT